MDAKRRIESGLLGMILAAGELSVGRADDRSSALFGTLNAAQRAGKLVLTRN